MNSQQKKKDKRKADIKEYQLKQKEAEEKYEMAKKILISKDKNKQYTKVELEKAFSLLEEGRHKIQSIPTLPSIEQSKYFHLQGKIYMEQQNYDSAHLSYVAACKFDVKNPVYHAARGHALLKLDGRIKEALEAYEEAITLNATDGHNFWNLAKVFAQLQSYQMAIDNYIQAIQLLKNENYSVQFQLLFEKGQCYLLNRQFQKAIIDLSKALEFEKENHQCINTLGQALFESGKFEQALEKFQKALEYQDKNSEYHNNKALALHNLEKYKEALDAVNIALELNNNSSKNHYTRGNILFKMGKCDESIQDFNIAIRLNSQNCMYFHSKGLAYNQKKDYETAIEMFQRSIHIQNDHIPSWFHLGIMYHKNGDLQQSIEALTRVLEIKQVDDREVRESRGKVYQDLHEYQLSIVDFDAAIEIDTSQPLTYIYRGYSYIEVNRIQDAIKDFKLSLQLGTKSPKVFSGIGKAYQRLQDYDKSLFYINLALEQRPNDVQFLIQRSDIYIEILKYKKAIEDLKQAADKKPRDSLVFYKRGIAYFKNKEYKNCIHDLYKSYEFRPVSEYESDLHYHIGISFANIQIFDKAIEPLSEAVSLDRSNPQYIHERAKCYLLTEQPNLAVKDFSKLITIQPQNSHAYFGRAFAYKAIGEYLKASADFDMAKALDPSNSQLSINFTMISNTIYIPLCKPGEEQKSVNLKSSITPDLLQQNVTINKI